MFAQTRPRFILSSERVFWGKGVRTHVNSKGKIPSTGKFVLRGESNPRRCIKQDSEPNPLPTSYSGPQTVETKRTKEGRTPKKEIDKKEACLLVGWLLNVPTTC